MSDVFLGRFVKAFGIRGELKFHPSEDFWEAVLGSQRLEMSAESGRRPCVLERARAHKRSYIVKIDGVDDRNRAEALVGGELFIDDACLDVDPSEDLLPYQVIGMKVRSESGEELGSVKTVLHSPAHDVYEVKGDQGTFMVPAVPEFIVAVDTEEHVLVLKPLPGLIGD